MMLWEQPFHRAAQGNVIRTMFERPIRRRSEAVVFLSLQEFYRFFPGSNCFLRSVTGVEELRGAA